MKLAAVTLSLGLSGSAIAGTIVVRAVGPSARDFPPGKSVAGTRVTLRAGDSLVLLDGKGTRTLSGPGTFALGATTSVSAPPSALGALLRNTGSRQVRTGAVRGGGVAQARSPSLWYVDTTRSGAVCLANITSATLWRPDMSRAEALTVTRAGDGRKAVVTFAAGQSVRGWPTAELPITTGAEYWLSAPGWTKPTSIRFTTLDADPAQLDSLGAALIAKGCGGQLDLLVDTASGSPRAGAG